MRTVGEAFHRHVQRVVLDAQRLCGLDDGREKVVIVDAGKSERALVHGLLRDLGRRNARDRAVFEEDRLRGRVVAAGVLHDAVAERGSPLNDDRQRLAGLRHGRAHGDHVGLVRREGECLLRGQTRGIGVVERQRLRAALDVHAGRAAREIRRRKASGDGRIVGRQREGLWRVRRHVLRHQLQRLAGRVLVPLQAPAFQHAPARREDRADVRGLDGDVACGIADLHGSGHGLGLRWPRSGSRLPDPRRLAVAPQRRPSPGAAPVAAERATGNRTAPETTGVQRSVRDVPSTSLERGEPDRDPVWREGGTGPGGASPATRLDEPREAQWPRARRPSMTGQTGRRHPGRAKGPAGTRESARARCERLLSLF